MEREEENDDGNETNDLETGATEEVEGNINEDRNTLEISRVVAEAVRESNLTRPMGLTKSATQWRGETTMQPTERMAGITRLLEQNRWRGHQMTDMADAYTQVPFNNSSREDDTSSIESYENDTIESMPSLEPRVEEEDEDESVNKCTSQDEEIPLYLPEDDDNEPDVPIPIVDEGNEDEAVIADEGITNQNHEAPASSVDMLDNDTVSILNGHEEANTSAWTTVPSVRTKPHTVTRSGRKCFTPKHLQDDHALVTLPRKTVETNPFAALEYDSDDEDDDLFYEPEVAAFGA